MPKRWRQLVRRNRWGAVDPKGPVWGVPYRWGCTLIAYRKDALLRCAAESRLFTHMHQSISSEKR